MIPRNTIQGFHTDIPIRLQMGNSKFGATHIQAEHGQWLEQISMIAPQFLHYKLGQVGTIHSTNSPKKVIISMPTYPRGFMVLQLNPHNQLGEFFGLTTIYPRHKVSSGSVIGRYSDAFR